MIPTLFLKNEKICRYRGEERKTTNLIGKVHTKCQEQYLLVVMLQVTYFSSGFFSTWSNFFYNKHIKFLNQKKKPIF